MIRKISILLFVLLLLPAMDAAAQNRPTRKALLAENEVLRFSLDSLQTLLDSLESRRSHQDSLLMSLYVGNEPEAEEPEFDYTPEVADSLLQLWYRSYAISDFDAVHEYDMDSVRFTSDVSDEEMVRRLADMNSFISLPFNDNVKNYIILYSEKMKERMGRILGLSQYYFPVFEDILSKYSLPLELKYMAIVESMLNPTATSRAGAKGIWQFMYATGRSYGLEITSYVDERMDVEKSMDAAARYLSDAYRIFGDWALAMSSYNCGAGNVSKAIRRAGGSMDYWDIYPYLPRETRGYVPAFVGVDDIPPGIRHRAAGRGHAGRNRHLRDKEEPAFQADKRCGGRPDRRNRDSQPAVFQQYNTGRQPQLHTPSPFQLDGSVPRGGT